MTDEVWKREVDNKLISHDKDIHSIAESVRSIDTSVKTMAELQTNQAIREEGFNNRIKDVLKTAERAHKRIDEHDAVFKRVMWIIITPVIVALLALVLHGQVTKQKKVKDLQSLTQAIQNLTVQSMSKE